MISLFKPKYSLTIATFEDVARSLTQINKGYIVDEVAREENILFCMLDARKKHKVSFFVLTDRKFSFGLFEGKKSPQNWKWVHLSDVRSVAMTRSFLLGWALRYTLPSNFTLLGHRFIYFGEDIKLCQATVQKMRKAIVEEGTIHQ